MVTATNTTATKARITVATSSITVAADAAEMLPVIFCVEIECLWQKWKIWVRRHVHSCV